MLQRKRRIAVVVALLGTVLIFTAWVSGCHRPPGFCGGGFHGEDFPGHVLERMDKEVKGLELTEAQQARYQEIRARVEDTLKDIASHRKASFQALKTEMDKDTPDLQVVADLLKAQGRLFPDRMTFFVDTFMEFYGILDVDQKGKVVDHLKKKYRKLEAFRAVACD